MAGWAASALGLDRGARTPRAGLRCCPDPARGSRARTARTSTVGAATRGSDWCLALRRVMDHGAYSASSPGNVRPLGAVFVRSQLFLPKADLRCSFFCAPFHATALTCWRRSRRSGLRSSRSSLRRGTCASRPVRCGRRHEDDLPRAYPALFFLNTNFRHRTDGDADSVRKLYG